MPTRKALLPLPMVRQLKGEVESMIFDLTDPAHAYIFGFLQADGHHYAGRGQKGRVALELGAVDASVLYDMQRFLPWPTTISSRRRVTNFSADHTSATLNICGLEGRAR